MFKFNRVVCGLLVCGCVAVVLAKPIKIFSLDPTARESVDADGMGLLNVVKDPGNTHTLAHLTLTDFTPNACYAALFFTESDCLPGRQLGPTIGPAQGLITNAAGNAHGEGGSGFGDATCDGTACIDLEVWFDPNCDGLVDEDGELAATGTSCPS